MKKTNLFITGAAALVALVAVSGLAMSTFAAEDSSEGDNTRQPIAGRFMTEEERTAWKEMAEKNRADQVVRREAVEAAFEAGSYSAWLEAVGEDCPILDKVNQDNFAQFAKAHSLQIEAKKIMEDLGIETGRNFGEMGLGHMKGGRGQMMR